MTERLLPYRTLGRQETEVAIQLTLSLAGGLATLWIYPDVALLGALGTYAGSALLNAAWVRVSGFERVTATEQHRRHIAERVKRSVWIQALNEGATWGALAGIVSFFSFPPASYVLLPWMIGGGLLVGTFIGLYLAVDARRESIRPGGSISNVTFAESLARHVAGYAMGLAAALAVAAIIENQTLAVAAILASFFIAKFLLDILLSADSSPYQESKEAPTWSQLLLALPFGAIWWGLPFGILAQLVLQTVRPSASLSSRLWLFGEVLILSGVVAMLLASMAVLMGLVPRNAADPNGEVRH